MDHRCVDDGVALVVRALSTFVHPHVSNCFRKTNTEHRARSTGGEMNSAASSVVYASLPIIVIAVTSVAVMIAIAIKRNHAAVAAISFAGLAASFVLLWPASSVAPVQVTPLLLIDRYALVYMGLLLAATAAVVLLSFSYLEQRS